MVVGQATGHPSFMEKLASYTTSVESRVQLDGRVVTSRAPGTTMEFGVALVEQLLGKEKADEVAGPLVRSKKFIVEKFVCFRSQEMWISCVFELACFGEIIIFG